MDTAALFTGVIGAVCGAGVAYRVMRGQRWLAIAQAAVGLAALLNCVTLLGGSWPEHEVVFLIGLALCIFSMVAARADRKSRQRDGWEFRR